MDKIPDKLKPIIEKNFKLLKENNIRIDHAFLFGSYSKGLSTEFSDIDIALVSDIFSGDRIKDRDLIRKYSRKTSSLLEVMPFSMDDFNESNPFAKEIITTGIRIF